jgi:hypothetical protein
MDLSFRAIFAIRSAVWAKVLQFINSCLVPALPGCPLVPVLARLASFPSEQKLTDRQAGKRTGACFRMVFGQ